MSAPAPSPAPAPPAGADADGRVRRARWAATVAFATNGALLGAVIPHLPQAKAAFGLDTAAYGLLVIGLAVGGTLTGHLPAPVLRRFGSRRVVLVGSAVMAALTALAGAAVDLADGTGPGAWAWVFAALLVAAGADDAVVDTAQNAQGLRVQSALVRPVLTSMHAGWSLGAAAGAGLGALAVAAGWPAAAHLGLHGLACLLLVLAVQRAFLPDAPVPDDAAASPGDVPLRRGVAALLPLAPIVMVAMAGFGVEEFGSAWTALYLGAERGLDPAAAALGASVLLGAQFVGRLVGDRAVHALDRRRAVAVALGAAALGLALTLAPLPSGVAVVGLALAGLGCAVVVPTAYALADELPGLPPQTGLAVTSWLMRLAGIGLSPLVGLLAGRWGLVPALGVFLALVVLGCGLSLTLERPRASSPPA